MEGAGRKADFVADVVNRTLHDISSVALRQKKFATTITSRFSGMAARSNQPYRVHSPESKLSRYLRSQETPARLDVRSKKVPDGAGGLVEQQVRFPVWVDANLMAVPRCVRL